MSEGQSYNIYIPIWLDLLSEGTKQNLNKALEFTFQYG